MEFYKGSVLIICFIFLASTKMINENLVYDIYDTSEADKLIYEDMFKTYKSVSVRQFVDIFIHEYTFDEPINKIEVYFNANEISKHNTYNSYEISPILIHVDFVNGTPAGAHTNYDRIVSGAHCELSLIVSNNERSRPFNRLKKDKVYKLIIDTSKLIEFKNNSNQLIQYYNHSLSSIKKSELEDCKQNDFYHVIIGF